MEGIGAAATFGVSFFSLFALPCLAWLGSIDGLGLSFSGISDYTESRSDLELYWTELSAFTAYGLFDIGFISFNLFWTSSICFYFSVFNYAAF